MRLTSVLIYFLLPFSLFSSEKDSVQRLKLSMEQTTFTKVNKLSSGSKHLLVSNKHEAKLYFSEKDLKKLLKQVDFSKNKVLLFAWYGSGQDKLTPAVDKVKKSVSFKLKHGRTRDRRQHFYLFVVDKKLNVE